MSLDINNTIIERLVAGPQGPPGPGSTLPSVTNLLKGDGTGNALDSGIAAANVVQKQTGYATPNGIDDIVACLRAAGLCAAILLLFSLSPSANATTFGQVDRTTDVSTLWAKPPSEQTVGDANATWTAGKTVLRVTAAITANRTVALPLASAYVTGQRIVFIDKITGATSAFSHVFNANVLDSVNGMSSITPFTGPGTLELESDGVNAWTTVGDTAKITNLQDLTDPSRQAHFVLNGITGGQDRGMLWPDVDNWIPIYSGGPGGTPSSIALTNGTGLPISGLTASTSTAIGVGSIELGHPTDTTLTRPSAGRLAVEGNVVAFSGANTDIASLQLNQTGLQVKDAAGTHFVGFKPNETVTTTRIWSFIGHDANRTINMSGDFTLAADFQTSGANALTLTTTGLTNATIPSGNVTLANGLVPVAVQTSNYSAAAGDLVPVDTTSGNVTVTLPTAPANLTRVGVKQVTRGGTNTVTYQCGGSDVINKTGGPTSGTLTLSSQSVILQYKSSGAIWYIIDTDLPYGSLLANAQTWTGQQTFTAPNLGTPASGNGANITGLPISTGVSGLGTGVAAALAVNTGSAGAPVLFNGAGGTPSSLGLANATGLPVASITGFGTGVAAALAVNTNSAGGFSPIDGTATLSNKRINPRVTAITSNATWSPSADTDDMYEVTAQAAAVTTISNPSGTPVDGQKLMFRIKDNGTARALTWSGTQWRASSDLALPTTTVLSKTLYLGFIYNATDTKWDLVALLNNF